MASNLIVITDTGHSLYNKLGKILATTTISSKGGSRLAKHRRYVVTMLGSSKKIYLLKEQFKIKGANNDNTPHND